VSRRRGRPEPRAVAFFDHFRTALSRLPAGLIRVGAPADPGDLARAEAAVGASLPDEYAAFLRSFDGADLFQEAVLVAGVGPEAPLRLSEIAGAPGDGLVFAAGAEDERYLLADDGRVVRQDAGSDERSVAGSSFARWLDATVAAQQVLFGPDGEYAPDVFDPSGEEVTPLIALRQAERALKQDPGAAVWARAQGTALMRLGRPAAAADALESAAELDAANPWVWFDLGRARLEAEDGGRAAAAFERAARLEPGDGGAMLLAWAARAYGGQSGAAGRRLAAEALRRDPDLAAQLARAIETAGSEGDQAAQGETTALLAAIAPEKVPPPRVRLAVVDQIRGPTPRRRSPDRPPRPRREGPQRSGARPRGR
jgi:tetratricopeptide (TPR) repeat protein